MFAHVSMQLIFERRVMEDQGCRVPRSRTLLVSPAQTRIPPPLSPSLVRINPANRSKKGETAAFIEYLIHLKALTFEIIQAPSTLPSSIITRHRMVLSSCYHLSASPGDDRKRTITTLGCLYDSIPGVSLDQVLASCAMSSSFTTGNCTSEPSRLCRSPEIARLLVFSSGNVGK